VISLLINCEADINKLGFVPQNLAIDSSTLDLLNEDQKDFFQQEEQAISKYPDETYSHLVRKPLTKYLGEANHIQQVLRENLNAGEIKSLQKTNPYWTCIPELQKIAEHLKEKQKIICYLQNLQNLCVFLKTRQQAIPPDISLVHRIAPKIHSVVQDLENRIKAGCLANPSGLAREPLKALISQWTLIKEFGNNITQTILYQPPEQPAQTEGTTATKKTKQQVLFWAYINFLYQYRTTSTDLLQSITKGARCAFSKDKIKFYDLSHQERLERSVTFSQQDLQKFGHFPSLTKYPSDHPFALLISY
jgi:hypothetical protein